MKKVQRLLRLMIALAFLLELFPAGAFAQGNAIKMYLTLVPVYGQAMSVEGIALDESGNVPADYDALRVAMYVVQPQGNNYWPMPLGRVYSDGHLSVSYDMATASDRESAQLEILLLRDADSLPEGPSQANFESVRSQAIDALTITRTPEGEVSVTPERTAPELASPVSPTMFCLDVSFYTEEGSAPGSPLSEDFIREHLRVIRGFCDSIALYGAAHELEKIYPIAKNDFAFNQIVGTADFSTDEANNEQEYEALLNACRKGYVTTALLGNECLYRGKLSADKLIQYITRFREELADDSIIVSTSDNYDHLMANDAVCQVCPELWVNFYPVLGGSPVELAAGYLSRAAAQLKSKYPDKRVVVRETGWAVGPVGATIQNSSAGTSAVLGPEESARYFTDTRSWSIASATPVWWFSSFGEKWKSGVPDGKDYDSFWALFSENLEMLDAFKNTGYFCEVSYDSNGGSGTMRNVMVSKGAAFTPFSCQFVAPDGQQFKAWEINGTEYPPDAQVAITANAVVKAIWENILSPVTYTVVWLNGDGTELDRKTYAEGQDEPMTDKTPVKESDAQNIYMFDKWDDGTSEGNVKTYKPQFIITHKVASVEEISVIGQEVHTTIRCSDSRAMMFCAIYNNSGKMIAVRSVQITSESNYRFQFDGQPFDYAKAFIVDNDFRPLCESKRS